MSVKLTPILPIVVAMLAVACSGGGKQAETPSSPSSYAPGVATTATPEATATGDVAAMLASLFTDPRPRAADATRHVPARPATPFSDWDRRSVVLYDVEARTEKNYGEGGRPSFSADGRWFAFNVKGVLRLVELGPGDTLDVQFAPAPGRREPGPALFVDASHLYVPGGILDLGTGEVTPVGEIDDPVLNAKERVKGGSGEILSPDDKYLLRRLSDPAADDGVRWTVTEVATDREVLEVAAEDREVLEVAAERLAPAGTDEFVLATTPQCRGRDGGLKACMTVQAELYAETPWKEGDEGRYVTGTTNIFLINIRTNTAEFVATTGYTWPTPNWPLAADSRYVVWTDSYCGPDEGRTHIYDRSMKKLMDTDATLWVRLLPNGLIGVGDFGPKALLDPATLQWKITLPSNVTDVKWSPDGRYLAVEAAGHGGLC